MAQVRIPKTLLAIGVHSAPGFSHEMIKAAVDKDTAALAKMGITASAFYADFEGVGLKDPAASSKFPGIINQVKKTLQSQKWDCVTMGYGVRGLQELTPLFEDLVNAAAELEHRPRLLFPIMPDGIADRVRESYGL